MGNTRLNNLTIFDLISDPSKWIQGVRPNGIWPATVEDNADPEQRGRLRVRIHGIHSDNMKPDDLPWAMPLFPQGGSAGYGHFEVPVVGASVGVAFWIGSPDHPFWIGSFIGMPGGQTELVPEAVDGYTGEHAPEGVTYPNNSVRKTPGGILEERDDTEGQVRYHIRTPLGHTLILFDNGKKYVELASAGGFKIRLEDEGKLINVLTPSGQSILLDDENEKIVINTSGDVEVNADKVQVNAEGDVDLQVGGNLSASVNGNATVEANNATVTAELVTVESNSIDLGEATLPPTAGVVTGECIDPFTGSPFPDFSGVTRSKKLPS